jgi:thioredoxin reductase (NADPH)
MRDGELLAVSREQLRQHVTRDTALGDLILRALLQRRTMLIGLCAGFRIIGSRYSPDTRRLRDFASRNRLPHRWIDLDTDEQADALLSALGLPVTDTPIVIWRGTQVLRNPNNGELARLIGLPPPPNPNAVSDVLVVGAGPAGLAACVYAASEGLRTTAIDAVATGGQAESSPLIENYLGFPAGLSGAELAERAAIQAAKFGARITVPAVAMRIAEDAGYHVVDLQDHAEVRTRAVLISTGAQYRKLDVPDLARFESHGVYYAATQTEARLCGGDPIAVVGGGNSAGQAALFLARHAARVTLIVRGDDLGKDMSRYLVNQLEHAKTIEVLTHTEVRSLIGDRSLEALIVEDNQTGQRRRVEAGALFVFIGARPGTGWLAGALALDDAGFVLTGSDVASATDHDTLMLESSRRGVFAAGDVRSGSVKRVASAVGEGAIAVRMIHERLHAG